MEILFPLFGGHSLLGKFKLAHMNRTIIWLICTLFFINFAKLSALLDLINFLNNRVIFSRDFQIADLIEICNLSTFALLNSESISPKLATLHKFINLQLALDSVKFGLGCSIKIYLFLN